MIDAILFGKASEQTQKFRNIYGVPFGGMDYDVSGDFFQLPPVLGTSLVDDVLIDAGIIPAPRDKVKNDKNYASLTAPRQQGIASCVNCDSKNELNMINNTLDLSRICDDSTSTILYQTA